MKELSNEFTGTGEVRGFLFKKLEESPKAYLYEVTTTGGSKHYEVFEKKINQRYNTVSYPKAKSFGKWAFSMHSAQKARLRFEVMSDMGK